MNTLWAQLITINPIDWFAMLTGICGVWLSIKEKVLAWPLFILCYAAYIYISFRGNYYAFAGLNIIFVGVALYGWCQWAKSEKGAEKSVHISHVTSWHGLMIGLLIGVGTLSIGGLLSVAGEARLPYLDAFATSTALAAQWMLSRKHIQTWAFWIISDCVYLSFFFNDRIWPSVFLFTAFIGLAVKGWLEWNTILAKAKATE